ncbi:MAG: T9SS C-terminal target domain-containing protein, partial [Bacteroidetes bacterium]
DRSGNLLDAYEINSTDLGSITAGAFSESGRFIGAGYYRGRMDLGKFAFDSPQAKECRSDAGFTFAYDPAFDEVRAASTTTLAGQAFYPTDMKVYQGHVYYLGTVDRHLVLLKYTEEGYLVGYKKLNQYANVFDFEYDNYFDVRDGYIVLSGTNYLYDAATGVNPLITHCNSLSILKIEDKDWVREGDWLLAQSPDLEAYGESLVVYPNPFRGRQVRILMGEDAQQFTRYELFTLLGQSLGSGTLDSGESVQELTLPELKPGTYLMRFSGSQQVKTVKVIREP